MIQLEGQIRLAIRDAVNRASRKPFYWGGLAGYRQLDSIAQALHTVPADHSETVYMRQLARQVDRALEKNRALAQDVAAAQTQLGRIAECLRYPPRFPPNIEAHGLALTSQQVKADMEQLLHDFKPDLKRQPAQAALYQAWRRVWQTCGADVLPCYDIPGLPQDNLQLEGFFGQLRRDQRRISGRQSTAELRDFGQFQALFTAQSEDELLQQIRQVSIQDYQASRQRLEEAEAPRQLLRRLHRDPLQTMHRLLDQHAARRAELAANATVPP